MYGFFYTAIINLFHFICESPNPLCVNSSFLFVCVHAQTENSFTMSTVKSVSDYSTKLKLKFRSNSGLKPKMRIQQNAEWCLYEFIPAKQWQRTEITVNFLSLAWYS